MKILVTGGSGFLGGRFIELHHGNHELLALARSEKAAARVAALGATPLQGDLDTVTAAQLQGCDAVIHSAALASDFGPLADFEAANVEGTRRLLAAARDAEVRRFVFVGTEAAIFDGEDLVDVDETRPIAPRNPFHYGATKGIAERLTLEANTPGAFETISIRPRFIWGPGDTTVLPSLAATVKAGAFAWIDGGRKKTSTAYVDNVVHALHLALEGGVPGQPYFITDDETTTYREFLTALLATAGLDPGNRQVPGWLVSLAASASETFWRVARRPGKPPLTRMAVAFMRVQCTLRIDKARRELGYAPLISVAEGLKHTAASPPAP